MTCSYKMHPFLFDASLLFICFINLCLFYDHIVFDFNLQQKTLANLQYIFLDGKTGFTPYLRVLLCKNRSASEMVISHLESVICSLRSEMRLQLATEVILPYLNARLEITDSISDHKSSVLISVLDILCTLVTEQPTAMVLIREQKVWTLVKKIGSKEGNLSHVCQQIIKNLVINSHKFKKIRLSEAEAMALQDDENDRINFDER